MIEKFKGIKGAIFDIDGTILDSMEIWDNAGTLFLAQFNIHGEENLGKKLFTKTTEESAIYLNGTYNLNMEIEDIQKGINKVVADFYRQKADIKPRMRELLKELAQNGVEITAATSTDRHIIMPALERLDLVKYFDGFYTCTEIGHSKNEPHIFNAAMNFMKTEPSETWLFEDGLYSAKTAKKMGLKVVGVYDEISKHDWEELEKLSDAIIIF